MSSTCILVSPAFYKLISFVAVFSYFRPYEFWFFSTSKGSYCFFSMIYEICDVVKGMRLCLDYVRLELFWSVERGFISEVVFDFNFFNFSQGFTLRPYAFGDGGLIDFIPSGQERVKTDKVLMSKG